MIRDLASLSLWGWAGQVDQELQVLKQEDSSLHVAFKERPDLDPFRIDLRRRRHASPLGDIYLTTPVADGGRRFPTDVQLGDELVVQWKSERKSYSCRVTSVEGSRVGVEFPHKEWEKTIFTLDLGTSRDERNNQLKFVYLIVQPPAEAAPPSAEPAGKLSDGEDASEAIATQLSTKIGDYEIPLTRDLIARLAVFGLTADPAVAAIFGVPPIDESGDADKDTDHAPERVLFAEPSAIFRKGIVATTRRVGVQKQDLLPYDQIAEARWGNGHCDLIDRNGKAHRLPIRDRRLATALGLALQLRYPAEERSQQRFDLELAGGVGAPSLSLVAWESAASALRTFFRIAKNALSPEDSIRPQGFAQKPIENFYWHSSSVHLLVPRTKRIWIAGSAGISYHVAKGVTLRLGLGAAQPVDEASVEEIDSGEVYVSDVRLVFVGKVKFLDLPLARIAVSSWLGHLNVNTSYRGTETQYLFQSITSPWDPITARHVIEHVQAVGR